MAILFIDDHSGIYVPQRFANEIDRSRVSGVTNEQWECLENGPEGFIYAKNGGTDPDIYWEVWDEVLDSATITDFNGMEYRLYQDGALFFVTDEETVED